jgi:DNA mismatch repair protein MutS2
MIYPENFENKIGFDRIRNMLSEKCLSPMGLEKVNNIKFIDDFEVLNHKLSATYEFQQILIFEDFFPIALTR